MRTKNTHYNQTMTRPLKWKTIKQRYPNMWVAIKPTGPKYSWDGVVLVSGKKNDSRFNKQVAALPEKYLAVSYTGEFIQTKKNENVLLSIW